jgi:N-acetylglutamate synthase-like GNAT family acetyltransferase
MKEQTIDIIEFDESLSPYFKKLNMDWLKKYFYVEPVDEQLLGNPKQYIINGGGCIFFAKVDNEIVGTAALIKIKDKEYELGKMAVDERHQGKKIGNRLLEICLQKAKELGAKKIILFSNTILKPAIHLYQKFGFTEVPVGNSEYKRSNIKMEKVIA